MGKIRVLVVDDSPLMREIITTILNSDADCDVIATATNGKEGVEKALALRPNVITMDIKMCVMDGVEATQRIMEDCPTPIIVISSENKKDIANVLEKGAMDFIAIHGDVHTLSNDIIEKVKTASKVRAIRRIKTTSSSPSPIKISEPNLSNDGMYKIIVIGASTGGPQAIEMILSSLPTNLPATILIVQHMSTGFIEGMVHWLQRTSNMPLEIIKDDIYLRRSHIFIIPENKNVSIDKQGYLKLTNDNPFNHPHIPSIDYTMQLMARTYGNMVIGIVLTGMGKDGADGIAAIKNAGGSTIAQDKKTSMVFGMNAAAIETGKVDIILPLTKIASQIIALIQR